MHNHTIRPQKRLLWIDLIKIFSIFFVIVLHVNNIVLAEWNSIPVWWRISSNLYRSISVIAVPLFILASGQLLLDKKESYVDFFYKRVRRIILPWLGWALFYFIWTIFIESKSIGNLNEAVSLLCYILFNFYWFIPMIAGLYFLTPLLRVFIKAATKKDLYYFVSIWFLIFSIIFFFQQFFNVIIIPDLRQKMLFLSIPYSGYFILGYLITKTLSFKISYKKIVLLYIITILATFFCTFFTSQANSLLRNNFFDYMAPNIIIQTGVFFSLFSYQHKKIFSITPFLKLIIMNISKMSLGIYLSNKLIMDLVTSGLFSFKLDVLGFSPIFSVPLISLIVFLLSCILISCLRKIPFLKYFVT